MPKLRFSTICAWFVIVLALVILAGWHFDLILLRRLLPGAPQTTPLTTLMLLGLGLALLIDRQIVAGRWPPKVIWAGWGLTGGVVFAAIWTGWQYLFRLEPGIELFLYAPLVRQQSSTFPGRPSPHTILTCLLIGVAISCVTLASRRLQGLAMWLGLAGLIIPWLALFGYLSLTNPLYALPGNPETGMSPLTAVGFLALGLGVIGLQPSKGLMDLLTASSAGGQIVRIMLPVAVLVPLLLGWLVIYGSAAGVFDPSFGFALSWGVISLLLTGLIVWQGFNLHRRDLDLARIAGERDKMLAELERSNHDLNQFAYLASHDLQEPLLSLGGFVQLLQQTYQGRLDEQADDWINRTVESARRMQTMIRDILTYSRIGSRARSVESTSLSDVFAEVTAMLAAAIRDTAADVTRDELPIVPGDRTQLTQLLLNLIGNALKYRGDEPPQIHVSAQRQGLNWCIVVRDNGIGIAPRHQQRIFEAFHRLHSQREYPGTGIGLALCRRVVERHGGQIWVESQVGQGSTFYFTLPTNSED